ncbi:ferredoxin [Kribbella sp. NPDC050470]|uniref:ferredoxin n=1 Tax=unclassified Kribbella TaxID=2644121 RepID=UPI003794B1F3
MARWKVTVDPDACTGSGLCLGTAPDHFEFGSDRRSRPRAALVDASDPDDDAATTIADAAECCPMAAITIVDADSGRQLLPEPAE